VGNGLAHRLGPKNTAGWVGLANGVFRLGWIGLKEFVALGEVGFGLGFSPLAGLTLRQGVVRR
jgi:hypothetical protein